MTYRKGDYFIGVGEMPKHKKPCLYVGVKCFVKKVASFNGQDEADMFTRWLECLLGYRDNPAKEGE